MIINDSGEVNGVSFSFNSLKQVGLFAQNKLTRDIMVLGITG